ncbi:MAG: hypothetical protein FJ214_07800 [Ignavibacteria bacterium]|nr:hypothetical protein [Ignavibacteria bacterium]
MKKLFERYQRIILIVFVTLFSTSLNLGQTFGFGCLGLSGFYAGFTKQQYNTDGINQFINSKFLSTSNKINFKEGSGYRIGTNLFRAKFEGFFISAKGYYQFLKETHELVEISVPNSAKDKYTLNMNHWGLAIDFGVPIISFIDLKLLEGGVQFFNIDFNHQYYLNDLIQNEKKYEPEKSKVSYFIGSGLIIHLIPDYISVEGTAAYSFIKYEKLVSAEGSSIPTLATGKIPFDKGGFSATVQLNIGFPL